MISLKQLTRKYFKVFGKYRIGKRYSIINVDPLSPLDGRYKEKVEPLMACFSEKGFNKYRINVEIKWLIYLIQNNLVSADIKGNRPSAIKKLEEILGKLDETDYHKRVKEFESITNHDIKAVEYYVKEILKRDSELERK